MKHANYITILAWMGKMGLSLVEKTVYAVIYGFSQDDESDFHGSRQYLAEWCESSTKTIDRALARLCELGYIHKREVLVSGVKFCRYSVDVPTVVKMSTPATICPEGSDILGKGGDKMSHNNIVNNIDNNIESKGDAKRFTPPTLEEVSAYCAERRNRISPQHFIDFYSANGWMVGRNRMKDWRAAVRNWETREKEKRNGTSNIDKGSPAAYRHLGRGDDYGPSTL